MTSTERTRTLDARTLNRTLLERQLLLRRHREAVPAAIRHLVGMQAQEPRDPYVGLWIRLERFDPQRLSVLLERRKAVRMTLLRGTLHLVTADDAIRMRDVIHPAVEALISGSSPMRRAWDAVERDELTSFLRELLDEKPRSRVELVRAIAERWPTSDADSLGYAMYLLPTVQVTPRGLWGGSGRAAFTTMESWLGASPTPGRDPSALLLRYLRAFGPASVADAQTWSRLTGLREVIERLAPRLRTFRDEDGRQLYDVPRAPVIDPDTPAPVRFLPEYDNVVLSHKDRSRIIAEGTTVWTEIGWGTVLVDGFTAARWKLPKGSGRLEVEPFRRLTADERHEVTAEGLELVTFLAPETSSPKVRFRRAG
jgi:Winged helix DNA-binding domain